VFNRSLYQYLSEIVYFYYAINNQMTKRIYILIIILVSLISTLNAQHIPHNHLFAQCTFTTMLNPPSIDETASLLYDLGYNGLEAWGENNFFESLSAAHSTGLSLTTAYCPLYIKGGPNYKLWKRSISEMIGASDSGTIFCFYIPNVDSVSDRFQTEKGVVETLRGITLLADKYGARTCVYPHYNSYCETVASSVQLSKQVNHKACGVMLTLCHLLKTEGADRADEIINEFAPCLFVVTISGADNGDTKQMTWERLIQPLGQGSFDTYHVLKLLWDSGYKGPVGIQFYGIKEDASSVIKSSYAAWEGYKKKYLNEKCHGKDR